MTNKEILDIAMAQAAIDSNCDKSDFLKSENVVAISRPNLSARKYLKLPFFCDLTSYGNNVVASVNPAIADFVKNYIYEFKIPDSFEPPNIQILDKKLNEHGFSNFFYATYYLPDVNLLIPKKCSYELKMLDQKNFADLYKPEWSNALCKKRKELDVLGIGAYDGEKLIGLAACSADCETMWQIGIDVLPEYRRQSVASTLTNNLAIEIFNRGKIPFYCTLWSNIKSARNAIKSGFWPTWVQMTAMKN